MIYHLACFRYLWSSKPFSLLQKKSTLVVSGPPSPPNQKYISKNLHDSLLESFAINLYVYLGHLAQSFANKLMLKSPLYDHYWQNVSNKMSHRYIFLVEFYSIMSTSTPTPPLEHFWEEHPWISWAASLSLTFGRQ